MKALLLSLFLVSVAIAAPVVTAPKPPVGVPADAKFFNGKWYRVYFEKVPWNDARDKCKTLGGQLVVVPDSETWKFVKALAPEVNLWLGATDEEVNGLWKWVDGSPMRFKAWASGQPDNANGKERYLAIFGDGWGDVSKTPMNGRVVISGFICQWVR